MNQQQEGGYVDDEYAYTALVGDILRQKYPSKKIACYNKGISSIETTAILRNLDKNMVKYKPDLVLLMAGWNDNFVQESNMPKLKLFSSKFRIYRLLASIKDISKLAPETAFYTPLVNDKDFRYTQIYVPNGMNNYCYKPVNYLSDVVLNLNFIIQTVHSYGSNIWFVGYLQPDAREKVNPVLRKVAEENNVTYLGDYPLVDFVVNRSLFADDGWHPSVDGHRIIAEKIAERIISEGIIDRWQPSN